MSASCIELYAEDFSAQGGSARRIGEFATATEARIAAETRIVTDLQSYYRIGQSPEDQLRQWMMFGEDLFLIPDDPITPFSALGYARCFLGIIFPLREE